MGCIGSMGCIGRDVVTSKGREKVTPMELYEVGLGHMATDPIGAEPLRLVPGHTFVERVAE